MRPWEDVGGKGAKRYRGMCREVGEGREATEGSMERERLRSVRMCRKRETNRGSLGREDLRKVRCRKGENRERRNGEGEFERGRCRKGEKH